MKKIKQDATNPLSDTLPERLKMCRKNAGFSLREVAQKMKKSAATICKWESGKVTPYAATLIKLCDIYKVDITAFYGVNTTNKEIRLAKNEIELIDLYRNATKNAQITIKTVLENCQKK